MSQTPNYPTSSSSSSVGIEPLRTPLPKLDCIPEQWKLVRDWNIERRGEPYDVRDSIKFYLSLN